MTMTITMTLKPVYFDAQYEDNVIYRALWAFNGCVKTHGQYLAGGPSSHKISYKARYNVIINIFAQ